MRLLAKASLTKPWTCLQAAVSIAERVATAIFGDRRDQLQDDLIVTAVLGGGRTFDLSSNSGIAIVVCAQSGGDWRRSEDLV